MYGMHAARSPPQGHSSEEADSALLEQAPMWYSAPVETFTTVPFARENVSWPALGSNPKHLSRFLAPDLRLKFDGMGSPDLL